MKKTLLFFSLLIVILGLTSCSLPQMEGDFTIVTSSFPFYDFSRTIVGDKAEVKMLLLPGQDAHSFDPSTHNIITIKRSHLFIYMGDSLETWAGTLLRNAPDTLKVLDASRNIPLAIIEDHDHDHDGHEEETHRDPFGHVHTYDPHIWINPIFAMTIVRDILEVVIELDPANQTFYEQNAHAYLAELEQLDLEIKEVVSRKKRDTLYFGAPFAFYYFVEQYGLKYRSVYETCSVETDPSIHEVIEMIKEIDELDIPVIYQKELLTNTICQKIVENTNAEAVLLHSAHNVTPQEFKDGATYLSIMKDNIKALERGLCE